MMSEPVPVLGLAVSDIRQYVYCPRIPYYRLGLRLPHRFVTSDMQEGIRAHEETTEREHRRTLRAYGLDDGERLFDVHMYSARLGLGARLDMLIRRRSEVIPVEFKNTDAPIGQHHKYQLTAYAMIAEDQFRTPVRRVFVYFIPRKSSQEVAVTPGTRAYTRRVLRRIRETILEETIPEGTRILGRCAVCEFLPYCNDRW